MKNNDKLFDEIGNIDDDLIPAIVKEKRKKKPLIIGAGALAAAAAVGIVVTQGLGIGTVPWENYRIYTPYDYKDDIAIKDDPPQIPHIVHWYGNYWEIPEEAMSLLYYKDEMETNLASNPWSKRMNEETEEELKIEKLPVFKNNFFEDYGPAIYGHLSEEELTRMLDNTATALGLTSENPEFYYEDYSELPVWLTADCDGEKYGVRVIHLTVYGDGRIRVNFNFYGEEGDHPYYMPEIEGLDEEETARLLIEKFGNLMQYENPTVKNVSNQNGLSSYTIYDASDDLIQNMLNYSFASVSFSFNENNELYDINMNNSLLGAECVAEYPIISLEEARQLLNRGCYIKRFPDTFFKDGIKMDTNDIVGVELVYYDSPDEYFKPYYRFYIELGYAPYENTVYGDLYVPAIEGKYVEGGYSTPDFTGEAYEAFPDVITLPDGSSVNKEESCGVYMRDGVPMLEFNFGFMRYAEPICANTLKDPDCFDFETGAFDESIDTEIPEPEYFMVKPKEYLPDSDNVPVQNAKYCVTLVNGEPEFYSCEVTVIGLSLTGIITCEEEEPETGEVILGESAQLIYFYADPVDSFGGPIPLIYTPDKPQPIEKVLEEDALITDGFKSCINRITPYDNEAVMLGYDDILEGTKGRIAYVSTSEVTYRSDVNGSAVYVHMLEFAAPNDAE